VGIQPECPANPDDDTLVEPAGLNNGPGAPAGGVLGTSFHGPGDHLLHLLVGDLARLTRARCVPPIPPSDLSGIVPATCPRSLDRHRALCRDRGVAQPTGTIQDDGKPLRGPLIGFGRRAMSSSLERSSSLRISGLLGLPVRTQREIHSSRVIARPNHSLP